MFSQYKNKQLLPEKGDKSSSRVLHSTFVYLLTEYYQSELCNKEPSKMKALGEQLGPRVYEALHYSKDNKYNKRFVTPMESIKFLSSSVRCAHQAMA